MVPARPDAPPRVPLWRVIAAGVAAPLLAAALAGLVKLPHGPYWVNAVLESACFLGATLIAYRFGGRQAAPAIAVGMSVWGSLALVIVLVDRRVGSA